MARKPQTKSTSKKSAATDEKKPHRFRAGTTAKRLAIKQKRSTKTAIRRQPFIRVVKALVKENLAEYEGKDAKMRLSAPAAYMLQYGIEQYLVGLLRDARRYQEAAGRVTLQGKDLLFARQSRGELIDRKKEDHLAWLETKLPKSTASKSS